MFLVKSVSRESGVISVVSPPRCFLKCFVKTVRAAPALSFLALVYAVLWCSKDYQAVAL